MRRRDNQPEITPEKLFVTLKQSRKALISIALFFVIITLLVKIGIKSSMPEPSKLAIDSTSILKLPLIRQYVKSIKLKDKEAEKVENAYIQLRYNQKPIEVVNDSLSLLLNEKLKGSDSIGIESLRIDLFEVKIKSDSNFLNFHNELTNFLTRKQRFELIKIIQPADSSKN